MKRKTNYVGHYVPTKKNVILSYIGSSLLVFVYFAQLCWPVMPRPDLLECVNVLSACVKEKFCQKQLPFGTLMENSQHIL